MDDALAVGIVEGLSDVRGDTQRLVHGKLMFAVEPLPKALSLYMRHDVEQEAVGLTRVVQRQNVGVTQVRRGLDLGQETVGSDDGCEFGLQDLERDFALVLDVVGQVDCRHPALTELGLDAVAAGEGCV